MLETFGYQLAFSIVFYNDDGAKSLSMKISPECHGSLPLLAAAALQSAEPD